MLDWWKTCENDSGKLDKNCLRKIHQISTKIHKKIHPKSDLEQYQHFSQVFHRILKDLAPPRTSKIVLPSRREANFQDFALLLLNRFFINSNFYFCIVFGTTFASRSLQHALQSWNKKWADFDLLFHRFSVDFGLHLGTHFHPKSREIQWRSEGDPFFFSFSLLVASLGYPPGSDLLDFRPNLGRFCDHFWELRETVFDIFAIFAYYFFSNTWAASSAIHRGNGRGVSRKGMAIAWKLARGDRQTHFGT